MYIVIGRYGVLLEQPSIYDTKEEAEADAKQTVINRIVENMDDEDYTDAQNAGVIDENNNIMNIDDFLDWASENDLCSGNLTDGLCATIGDDWTEVQVCGPYNNYAKVA